MLTQYRMDNEVAKLMRRRCGAYIKGLRIDAGLTQAQVAKALGYTYYTMISQVESGKARIPPEDYPQWAALLKVDLAEFAKTILSFMDPFTYHAIFGGENPIAKAQRENVRHKRDPGSRLVASGRATTNAGGD